ncbi:MAG: hypothetical protein LBG79_07530, partial [Spirochaetaceae bacterium]|jgi:molybdenum transport protein|nr:hypothetical protein [Spirochaetaceae bacterium]
LDGGGIIHRGGAAETVLLFKNHRNFLECSSAAAWKKTVSLLKQSAPEKKIVVEAENYEESVLAIDSGADIVQLDKFSLDDFRKAVEYAAAHSPCPIISAAGGLNKDTAALYAAAGAGLIVSSAPFYAKPADIKVSLRCLS